jgi:hypothetical protein
MNDLKQMALCTTKRKVKNGNTCINCKLGLWGVSAPDEMQATYEAMHYFRQYRDDGEYSSIIGGKSAIERLMER